MIHAKTEGDSAYPSAIVDSTDIGDGTQIWHFSHLMAQSHIGCGSTLGQSVFVASNVCVGSHVIVQNNVSLYEGTIVEDFVYRGPCFVLTNVADPQIEAGRKHVYAPTHLKRGVTLGAHATIGCGVTVGAYAFVTAGCVIAHDVADYALMMGMPNVCVGYISRHGRKLPHLDTEEMAICPQSGWRYERGATGVVCLDWDAYANLPEEWASSRAQAHQKPRPQDIGAKDAL